MSRCASCSSEREEIEMSDEDRITSRQRRIWAISRILGVPDADQYCVLKGDVVRLIREGQGDDSATGDLFISALERDFPGPDHTPVAVVFLAMLMRETGDASTAYRTV